MTFYIDPFISFSCPVKPGSSDSAFGDLERDRAVKFKCTLSQRVLVGRTNNMFERRLLSSLNIMAERTDIFVGFTLGVGNRRCTFKNT